MTDLRSTEPFKAARQRMVAGPLGSAAARRPRWPGAGQPSGRHVLRGGLLSTTALVGAAALVWASPEALAGPTGGTVVAGNATISTAGATTQVSTNTQRTIINWTGVSLQPGETMKFVQPSTTAATLNRVTGNDPSVLLGTLTSNGQVYLINPNGIVVGAGARIDTAAFVASTLNVPDSAFLSGGSLRFSGTSTASIQNLGTINATVGDAVLVGQRIDNQGTIRAPLGTVGLAAGTEVLVTQGSAPQRVQVLASGSVIGGGISNSGIVQAGAIELAAAPAPGETGTAIDVSGQLQGQGVAGGPDGHVSITSAGGTISIGGTVVSHRDDGSGGSVSIDAGSGGAALVSGTIDASGLAGTGTKGGLVAITGMNAGVMDGGHIDASGDAGGGTVKLGGGFQGNDPSLANANAAYVAPTGSIAVDARVAGDGGQAVVWSDSYTNFRGRISARGGARSGHGGSIEVSSHGKLDFLGSVDLVASAGKFGTLLLDPLDLVIDTTGISVGSAGANTTFTPSNTSAATTITPSSIEAVLASGNLVLKTTGTPAGTGQNGDITVNAAIDETQAPITPTQPGTLTLLAQRNITVNAPISVFGDLTLNATGGSVLVNANAALSTADVTAVANIFSAGGIPTTSGVLDTRASVVIRAANDITILSNITSGIDGSLLVAAGGLSAGASTLQNGPGVVQFGNTATNTVVTYFGGTGDIQILSGTKATSPGARTNLNLLDFDHLVFTSAQSNNTGSAVYNSIDIEGFGAVTPFSSVSLIDSTNAALPTKVVLNSGWAATHQITVLASGSISLGQTNTSGVGNIVLGPFATAAGTTLSLTSVTGNVSFSGDIGAGGVIVAQVVSVSVPLDPAGLAGLTVINADTAQLSGGGTITESGAARIISGTLAGSAFGPTNLNSQNFVATLASFSGAQGTISFTDTTKAVLGSNATTVTASITETLPGITVSGPVASTAGQTAGITIVDTGGLIILAGNVLASDSGGATANGVTLSGTGITQNAGSTVDGGSGTVTLNANAGAAAINGRVHTSGTAPSAATNAISIFGGAGVSQAAGGVIDGGSGSIILDAGGGGSFNLAGTVQTTSAQDSAPAAVRILDGVNAVLGNINAVNGTVIIGNSPTSISGTVSQTAGTAINAKALASRAEGNVTLTNAGNAVGTLSASNNGSGHNFAFSDAAPAGGLTIGTANGQTGINIGAGTLALAVTGASGSIAEGAGAAITAAAASFNAPGGAILTNANNVAVIAALTNNAPFSFTDATDLTVGSVTLGASTLVGIDPPSTVTMVAPTVTLAQSVVASSLSITATATTGAGPLINQTGGTLDVSGDVTLVASLHPTLGGANVQVSTGNLTLGSSQVQGDFVLTDAATGATLTQVAGSTLAVAGNATLTASTIALNGTGVIGGSLVTNGATSGGTSFATGIGGTVFFSNGTFAPGGGATGPNFDIAQLVPAIGTLTNVTLNLSPILPSISASKGNTAISIARAGNHMGGTLVVQTGSVATSGAVERDFNLVQSGGAINFGTLNGGINFTVEAAAGTSFAAGGTTTAGTDTLNGGKGSTVSLGNGGNTFRSISLVDVSDSTIAGTGPLTIGASTLGNFVHGNLGVSMAGSGGITVAKPVTVSNVTRLAAPGTPNGSTLSLGTGGGVTQQAGAPILGGTVVFTAGSTIGLGDSITAGELDLTGNGLIQQTGGTLVLGGTATGGSGDLNVTDLAAGDATLTGNTSSTLTLGNSSVTGDLVLKSGALVQPASNTLVVGGNLDLTAVGAPITFNGTAIVGQDLLGTTPVTGGLVAVGGLNRPQLAQGTIAPTFNNVSGTNFTVSQQMLDLARSGVGSGGTVTVQLFGAVANQSLTATHGAAVQLSAAGNRIGGTARVNTGNGTLTATAQVKDVNLREAAALSFLNTVAVVAHAGISSGGTNPLNSGAGSTILLDSGANTFGTISFTNVAATTLDGTGGIVIGASTLNGPLTVSMTGTGGIATSGAIAASNQTVTLSDLNDGITLGANLVAGALSLTGNGTIVQTGGTLNVSGNVDVTDIAAGDASVAATAAPGLLVGNSAVVGTLSLSAGNGQPLTIVSGATLQAANGDIALTGQTINLNNSTLIATGNLATTGTVTGTAVFAINGTNPVQTATGTIAASGASPDFTLTQAALNAAGGSIGATAPITVLLTNKQAAISGTAGTGKVSLVDAGNSIGGTLRVNTGTVQNSGGIVTKYYNLVETAALSAGAHGLSIIASAGTLFDTGGTSTPGPNTLNAGKGSTVSLSQGGNVITAATLVDVSDTTINATGGIAIGSAGQINYVHGNLAVGASGAINVASTIDASSAADGSNTGNTASISLGSTGGTVAQGGGAILETSLLTGAGTTVALNAGNQVLNLGSFAATAGTLSFTDATALLVTGPVTGQNVTLVTTGAGSDMTLAGTVSAGVGQVTLTSSRSIDQTAGAITAGTLTGSAAASAFLGDPTHLVNRVSTLGLFSSTGVFSLGNGATLTVAGPVTAAGSGGVTIANSAPVSFTGNVGSAAAGGISVIGSTGTGETNAITQTAASTLDGGAGSVVLDASGTGSFNLAGTVVTTSGLDTPAGAINVIDGVNAILGTLTAHNGTVVLGSAAQPLSGTVAQSAGSRIDAKAIAVRDTDATGTVALTAGGNLIGTIAATSGGIALAVTDATDLSVGIANGVVGVDPPSSVTLLAPTITFSQSVSAGSLSATATATTGAGPLISQTGGTLDIGGDVTLVASLHPTLGSATVQVSTGNLTLGSSQVQGDFVLTDGAIGATLAQPATSTLAVAGNATLTASTLALNGTVLVGGALTTNGIGSGTGSIGSGISGTLAFSNGTFSPGNGAATPDFNLDAFAAGHAAFTPATNVTLNLSPILPTLSTAKGGGTAINVALLGNRIGGTLSVQTGTVAAGTGNPQQRNFNLVQASAVHLDTLALTVVASAGTSFGGSNPLNAGAGSTVSLLSGANSFGTLSFTNVAGTTVDGTGGIVIGASTIHGNLAVSMTGSGGIVTSGAVAADNHTTIAPTNTAAITLTDQNDGITLGGGVTAGTLNLTGNGTIVQTAGILALAGDLNVTDLASGDATLTGNTLSTLTLGTSSVSNTLVLSTNSLLQTAGNTLAVGGDLDLTNVNSATFNGTVVVGNNILGTNPISGGTIAVGGLNNPQLAHGTIAPTFASVSGTTFLPSQGMVTAAQTGVGPGGTLTVQLFGNVASIAATPGTGRVILNRGGNNIGGVARIHTGATLTPTVSAIDVNLGEAGVLAFANNALILAHPGTLFGGGNSLDGGLGSTVLWNNAGNTFRALVLSSVADTTIDGSGGVTIGFGAQTNTVHGNLSLAMGGGITLATALVADNHTSLSPTNSAAVSFLADTAGGTGGITLAANLSSASLQLVAAGEINQTGGIIDVSGNVGATNTGTLGDASASVSTGNLTLGGSSIAGDLNVTASAAGATLTQTGTLQVGGNATLSAPTGTVSLTGTVQAGGSLAGATGSGVTTGLGATSSLVFSNGTFSPGGGSPTNFDLVTLVTQLNSQGIANATLNLSPTLSGFTGVVHGTGIKLTGANRIGGTLALKTGNLALKTAQETDFNLVQSAAVNLSGKTLLIEASTGTAFGGSNTLNAGIGSTVLLGSGTNGFGTLSFSNVSNTTVDGTGGIVIGASTFNGDFAVSMSGSGGIVTTGAILADNHLGPNSASVTFSDTGAGISIGGNVTAGTLNLTGNGTIVQTAGVLALAGDLNATDLAAGDATLTGNTAAGSSGTLTLGNSSVTGNLVLTSNSLLQTGGNTLVVGGDLDVSNVGNSTFNGTVIVGNNLLGTHPVTGGTIAVGGLNNPQLAQGTIAPTFNNISGTTFRPTQGMVDAASAGVGAGGTVTAQLFGAVADRSLSATHGAGILLNQGGNVIGGTARVKTGNGTLTANASSVDVNLGQVGALSFNTKALLLAHAGTLFGGPNTLNTGHGSTVLLTSIGNHFTSVALQDVSDSTLDGTGGVTIGFGSQINTVHGNLLVSMATSGGISLATDLVASNVASGSTLANSAAVSLDASNGDIGLGANLTAGSLGLRGNGTISQSPGSGTLDIAGNVAVVDIAAGDASVSATAAPGLVLGDSAVVGTLNISAGGSLPLTLAPGATLQAANGDIVLTGQPINLNNGTLIVTGNLVTNGTVIGTAKFAVNGTNPVLLANGTVVASGGSSDFTLTQTALNAAGASIGAGAPITVVLTSSQAAISGTSGTGKVSLVNLSNSIGGTLKVNTGTVLNSGGMVTKYFNLVETAALGLGGHGLSVLADPGTLFGGQNTLNAGKGSTVALNQGGNQFTAVQLQQVSDSTVDSTGGVTIGASSVHGNLTVSMTGSGGIATSGAILADNHTGAAPANTAVVTLSDPNDGIALGADLTAGTLNLTGNGSIVQTAGVLNLAGDLDVANIAAGNATLTGNTAAGSSGTLTLGNSSVNGDLVLQTNALLQPASDQSQGTKLVVGGTLDLTNVGTSTFNGTVIVGGDIQGTHPVTGGTIAVGGLNHPQLAQGTIAPGFNSISGATFTPSQAMLDAASSGVGSGGTITVQLFGTVADRSLSASGGGGQILLNQGGNHIGGVARIATGTGAGTLTANAASRDVNLGQVSALAFADKALILAHAGTLFGGPNTLNAGRGSTVLLNDGGNTFTALALTDVSDTTIDGSGGIAIGFGTQASSVRGNLTVSMTGTGGIATSTAITASNVTAGSTLANSAVVTLDDQDDGIALGANLAGGTLTLRGNGTIAQNAGTLALVGDLNVTDIAAGNATLAGNTGSTGTLNLGNSSINGDFVLSSHSLLQSAGNTLVVGGTLDLTNVSSATFNGTVAVGGDIAGTHPVIGGTIAVGGLNHPQLQQGTIAPTFNNVSGATFDPTQAMIDAARSGAGSSGTITVQLFGPIADQSLAPSGGTGRVLLNQSANSIGGVARVATGSGVGTLTATVSTRDVNLGQATSLAFSNNALVVARPGTFFGGPNSLGGGFGSEVLLDRTGNTFLGVALSNVADATIDGTGGITIGFGTQTNTVHGNLAVAMGGGVTLATSLTADNHTSLSPSNTAAVSFLADTAGGTGGITLAANLAAGSLELVAAGEINQTGGILDVVGNVGATNTGTLGDASATVSTGNLTLGGSSVAGNLLVSDSATGATLTQTGTLLVGGNATLSASTVSLTGTVLAGGSLTGASGSGVTTGLTSALLFSNGTFSPGGGSPTDFDLAILATQLNSQGISNATLNLSPTLTGLMGVAHGLGINLSRANHIGGVLALQTGSLALTAGQQRDFNLVESTAVQLAGKTLLIEANEGTLFGGSNTLNGGAGSTVSLLSGTNTFGALAFVGVAGTTVDGSGGITIGASSLEGNFTVSMSGGGGIATSGAVTADNSNGSTPTNTAAVSFVDSGAGIALGGDVEAGALVLTGNGLITQTAGILDIAGNVAVTDTSQTLGDATVAANTGSPSTLTLGGSTVAGNFVLTTPTLEQLAGTTLAVGGNLDLTNVGTANLNGTAIVGQNLVGSNPINGSVVVVGSLNQNLLAQGIIAPSFDNVTGLGTANPTFNITQGILSAATPNGGLVTVQLFGTLPDHTLTATHGQAVNLNQSGNRIGGTFTITTGPSQGSISLTSGDVNLGQSGAISTGSNLEILAHEGTVFGGTSTLNSGLGSFVNLSNASNVFGSGNAVFLSDVSNTTLDGSSGVTVGGTLGGSLFTNTVHGNLTVATGGEIDIASPIAAHSGGSTDTAVVSLGSANGAVSQDASNGVISAATLTGSAGTSASLGAGNTIGTLAGFAVHHGDFLFEDTTGVAVTGTVSATGGDASITAAGNILLGAPVNAATGAVTLDAASGAITDPTNTGNRTDVTAASVTLLASAGIGIPSGTSTAGTPLILASPMVAAVTDTGGINLVNNTGTAAAAVSTLGVTSGPGDILFLQRGGGNLSIGSATDASGSIAVDVQGADLTVTTASAGNGGNITLGLGGLNNLTLNGTVSAAGSVLGRAEINVHLDAATLTSGGRTTLVVDDAFPSRRIGPGALTVTGATTISTETGDNLALFLARRSQVTIGPGASLALNGQPFFDEPDAQFPKDQTVTFVHFGIYYSPAIAPDAGEPFTVFFKETLETPPPRNFEDETPIPKLSDQSYPIAFAMLYRPGNAPSTVASLAAISPSAGGPGTVGTSGTDGILGYARISSFDVAPDVFSAISRPLYMDIQNPKTEEQLGYELRPTLQARVEGTSAEALAGIEPGGPGAFSCARLPETLALLADNPELAQHLRDLCARQGQRDLPEVPARPLRYFRPAP